MKPEPLKITGPSFIGKRPPLQPGPKTMRLWPTNRGVMTLTQLSRSRNIPKSTLDCRIKNDGPDAPGLLDDVDPKLKSRKRPAYGERPQFPGARQRRSIESIRLGTWELAQLEA